MYQQIAISLGTGLRLQNVMQLRWDHILWDEQEIRLTVKGSKTHSVPISPAVHIILTSIKRGGKPYVWVNRATGKPFATRHLAFKALCQSLGILDLVWHDLRRTGGTRLYKATGDILPVQRFLGHSNPQVTLRYRCLSPKDVRSGLNLVHIALPDEDSAPDPAFNSTRNSAPPDAHPNYRHLNIAGKSGR
ncbi:tyrosine-type recombinase/integrase [Thermodesulfobacteriota bacterium]